MIFDENKTYQLELEHPEKGVLKFTAKKIYTTNALIGFTDRNGQQFIFDIDWVRQAKEVMP